MVRKAQGLCFFIGGGFLVLLVLFFSAGAYAQNSTTAGSLTLESTFECISAVATYSGDDNENNAVTFRYRQAGSDAWLQAHDMVRLAGRRWAGSIVSLVPGVQYEVRVEFADADGVDGTGAAEGTMGTRAEGVPSGSGATYHVSAAQGHDGFDGSEGSPWATIQRAADAVIAGDTVIVHEGLYREEVEIRGSGEPGSPITFRAAEGESAVIDGSRASLAEPGGGEWTNDSGPVWFTVLDAPTGYVAEDGRRLYHYETSLDDLRNLVEGYPGGWYYDDAAGRLYLRTREEDDPDGHAIEVGLLDSGFYIDGFHDIVIEGFEIRYQGTSAYGKAVYIRHSSRIWVRRCALHGTNGGVLIRFEDSIDNVIEWNEIYDNEVTSWAWEDVKAHDAENAAVSCEGGSGSVVRFNVVHGIFNGVALSLWDELENEVYNHNVDVYGNLIYDITDDGIEPEGAAINMRIWGNTLDGVYNCISLAPITVGPLYAWRNIMRNFFGGTFKVSISSDGPCFLYHNTCTTDTADTNGFSPSGPFGNMTFRNNILRSTRYVIEEMGENTGGVTWDYDNLLTTAADRFVKWNDTRYASLEELRTGTGLEAHGISAPSLFADVAALDFNLREGSPEIDAGMVIPNFNDGWCGSAPDIGAFEFTTEGCTPPNPDPPPEAIVEAEGTPDGAPDAPADGYQDGAPQDAAGEGQEGDGGGEGCGCAVAG